MNTPPTTRAAVVFGASGAIGRAVVERLLAAGTFAAVHAGSRRAVPLPTGAAPFRFDLADEASLAAALSALPAAPDTVLIATGLLHDAAGGITPEKSLRAVDPAAMARLYAVNTIGPALLLKHLAGRLPRGAAPRIGVLSARVGSIGDNRLGGWTAYRTSKAALTMVVRNAAIELARTHPGTVLAALHPGTVDSALSAPFQRGVAPGALFSPAQAAGHLLTVLEGLGPADSGGLFSWDGRRLPD